MDDVDVTLPTFERVTLALGFQPLMSKDVFHEPSHQPKSTAIQPYMTAYSYPNIDVQLLSSWDCESGLLYSPHRKRILTKDTTGALKLWLRRHKKNPYPSKAEKIMLAILSKMTLTQVSTWFANARRRLKKDYPDEDIQEISERFQDGSDLYNVISTSNSYAHCNEAV